MNNSIHKTILFVSTYLHVDKFLRYHHVYMSTHINVSKRELVVKRFSNVHRGHVHESRTRFTCLDPCLTSCITCYRRFFFRILKKNIPRSTMHVHSNSTTNKRVSFYRFMFIFKFVQCIIERLPMIGEVANNTTVCSSACAYIAQWLSIYIDIYIRTEDVVVKNCRSGESNRRG